MIDENRLPQGWLIVPFNEIAILNPRHPSNIDPTLNVSFVTMTGINDRTWKFNFSEIKTLSDVRKGYTNFAEGDILFAKITPCMENGKAVIAYNLTNGLGCGNTELHVIRPLCGIEPKFIYYFIHQEAFRKEASYNMTGNAGQLRVPIDFIRTALLPLPPLNEQRRIVSKLEKFLSKVEACKDRLKKIPIILKRFRQSVLASSCSGRLTADWREKNPDVEPAEKLLEKISINVKKVKKNSHLVDLNILNLPEIPEFWKYVSIDDLTNNIKYGTSQKCDYEKIGVPVLRIPNMADGIIDVSDLKYAELPENEYKNLKLISGDILLIRSNGSVSLVGKTSIVRAGEEGFAYAGYLIRLRFNKTLLDPFYINLALSSYYTRLQIEIPARSTSGVNNINSTEVKNLIIPLPPLSEQQEIVRRVESLFKLADSIEARYEKAKNYIEKLSQSILLKAFRGELVPHDPSDEPASVLLERIRKEKIGEVLKNSKNRLSKR